MNGILGTFDLVANTNTVIYTNNYDIASIVVINLCNRGNQNNVVSIAISTSSTTPANAEWIEFQTGLGPREVIERTGIAVSPGRRIVVRSTLANVSAVCYGVTNR